MTPIASGLLWMMEREAVAWVVRGACVAFLAGVVTYEAWLRRCR